MKLRDALALRTRVSEHQTALEDEIREFNLAMTLALRPHSQSMDNEVPADELARARRMALAAIHDIEAVAALRLLLRRGADGEQCRG